MFLGGPKKNVKMGNTTYDKKCNKNFFTYPVVTYQEAFVLACVVVVLDLAFLGGGPSQDIMTPQGRGLPSGGEIAMSSMHHNVSVIVENKHFFFI